MTKPLSLFTAALLGCSLNINLSHAADTKPLRVLLITGGCCHDYTKQKDLLKHGLEARANLIVDQIHADIPPGTSATKPPLPIYGNPDYAKGYDVVIHDECAADINDPAIIKGVLAPHRAGIPGVNLHCAIHCYRIGNPGERAESGSERAMWFDYLGIQSSGHGAQLPIAVSFTATNNAITHGLNDWTTINEELYNNVQVFPTVTPLAHGRLSGAASGFEQICALAEGTKGPAAHTAATGAAAPDSQNSAYCCALTAALIARCLSRVLPAIRSCMP